MSQPVLSLLPAGRGRSVGPSAGLVEGSEGGVVLVFGLATFTGSTGDEVDRRLAAVQLLRTKVASAVGVASAFAVTTVTLWRWGQCFTEAGVVGLIRARSGPKGPSKLTEALRARIVELDGQGLSLRVVAARTEVSTATVRVALGRVTGPASTPGPTPIDLGPDAEAVVGEDEADHGDDRVDVDASAGIVKAHAPVGEEPVGLVALAAPVPRTAERAAARAGDLVEAPAVLTEGAQLPLVGLLLALPALEMTGLLSVAQPVDAAGGPDLTQVTDVRRYELTTDVGSCCPSTPSSRRSRSSRPPPHPRPSRSRSGRLTCRRTSSPSTWRPRRRSPCPPATSRRG